MITPFTYLPPAIESRDATLAEALAQGLPLQLLLIAEEQKEALLSLPALSGINTQLALGQKAPLHPDAWFHPVAGHICGWQRDAGSPSL